MALPVLDGNQTATTLSSVVTGGEHIVAHSVVCLGSTAIANITNAVSGSVVSISNFPSTQTIAGTVTANLIYENLSAIGVIDGSDHLNCGLNTIRGVDSADWLQSGGGNVPISGTVTANVPLSPDVWAGTDGIRVVGNGSDGALRIGGYDPSSGAQLNLEEGGGIPVFAAGQVALPISGTVTVGNTVAISGTVTANPTGTQTIAGTVTVSAISTSVTARLVDSTGTAVSYAATGSAGTPSTDVISVQGVSGGTSLPISGTAGTLTTRFGSVTTANTAQISSAVTNTSRKYLLIQNVTTSSNVITIGVGFTPTTTQGIQLTAGAGITFESSYIPTGAVYVLSSVTASPFTILEA